MSTSLFARSALLSCSIQLSYISMRTPESQHKNRQKTKYVNSAFLLKLSKLSDFYIHLIYFCFLQFFTQNTLYYLIRHKQWLSTCEPLHPLLLLHYKPLSIQFHLYFSEKNFYKLVVGYNAQIQASLLQAPFVLPC